MRTAGESTETGNRVAGAPSAARMAAAEPLRGREAEPPRVLTRSRWLAILSVLAAASGLVIVAALRLGAEDISWAAAARILLQAVSGRQVEAGSHDSAAIILLQVRLPRVLLAFMVGGCLAAVGVGLQALLRNPLADPYVLGISSGAALGSAIALLLGIGTTVLAVSALPLCAFAGALISILLVYRIAVSYGHLPVHTLLLAGVILNAIFSAMIMFITSIIDPNRAFAIMSWLMGTLMAPDYPALAALAVYLLAGGLVLFRQGGALNLMTLGEEPARALGVEVERVKKIVFVCAALLTGAVVSVSGLIGFVGMVVPHAMRLLTGADHRLLLPASALVGGMFLTAADALARTVLAPAEIPVGVVTALVGGPFFIYLLMVKKRGFMR